MNYCCYAVDEKILAFLEKQSDKYTLVRLLPSFLEKGLSCPIFNLAECYYRDLIILDDKIDNFIKTFPGKKTYENME